MHIGGGAALEAVRRGATRVMRTPAFGIVAILAVLVPNIGVMSLEHDLVGVLGHGGYMLMGTVFFVAMMVMLYRLATKK